MDAIIFDFDGVVVDSEPSHLKAFAAVLAKHGIKLSHREYYSDYLGMDDHDCFRAIFRVHGRAITDRMLKRLINAKSVVVKRIYANSIKAQPGAVRLIKSISRRAVPIAICSGALGAEIRLATRTIGLQEYFKTILSADEIQPGKPDPLGYRTTITRLSESAGRKLQPRRTVVVEDAPAGIQAAKKAGMKVLAVTTSYPAAALKKADKIVCSLSDVTFEMLERIAGG